MSEASHPYGSRARLGLIVPPTNTVNEPEWVRMAPEGVTIHSVRMPIHNDSRSAAGRKALYADIRLAVTELAKCEPDAIAYGCTAGSMVLPIDTLPSYMESVTGVRSVATAPALVHACRALGARRVALATPYDDKVNGHERHFLEEAGLEVLGVRGLGIPLGNPAISRRIARVPLQDIAAHCRASDVAGAEALIVSCTDFPVMGLIERLEAELGKPVVSSNTATFWLALRTAGVRDVVPGCGRLFQVDAPA